LSRIAAMPAFAQASSASPPGVARKLDENLGVIDVADHQTREKARKMGTPADLEALFVTLEN